MKTVLVIELEDDWLKRADIDVSDLFADVTLYRRITKQTDYTDRAYHCWMPVKELPKKKSMDVTYWLGVQEQLRKQGWNECLEEIER